MSLASGIGPLTIARLRITAITVQVELCALLVDAYCFLHVSVDIWRKPTPMFLGEEDVESLFIRSDNGEDFLRHICHNKWYGASLEFIFCNKLERNCALAVDLDVVVLNVSKLHGCGFQWILFAEVRPANM